MFIKTAQITKLEPELIRFVIPNETSTLYVSGVSFKLSDAELKSIFSNFGLVNSAILYVKNGTENENENENELNDQLKFGFVRFYSIRSAEAACSYFKKNKWEGEKFMTVRFARKRKKEGDSKITVFSKNTLSITQSIELANYYIGYKNWSSSIVNIKLNDKNQDQINSDEKNIVSIYECEVKLIFNDNKTVMGKGIGIYESPTKTESIENAKKIAVTNARKDAFQKIGIVLLESGKVYLSILTNN